MTNINRVFSLSVRDVPSEPAVELRISGPIGETFWDDSGTTARKFTDALQSIQPGRKINLRINSEGGSVQDGLEIYNAIKARSADVTAHITGYAVSIASVIPLAASKVISPKASMWMIHNPWMYAKGNASDMRKAAEMLDKHGEVLTSIYEEATGLPKSEIVAAMDEEKWMTGEEAVAYGLADETSDDPVNLDGVSNRFGYRRAPAAMGDVPPPQRNNKTERSDMDTATNTTPSAGASTPAEEINAVKAELAQARKDLETAKRERITRAVDGFIAERKIGLDSRTDTIESAMKDEGILGILAKIPTPQPFMIPNGAAITGGPSCGLDHVMHLKTPQERVQNMLANWNEYRDQGRRFAPMAANTGTDNATLLGTFLDQKTITVLQTRLGLLRAFTNNSDGNPLVPLQPIILRTVTAGGTAQTDATSFEDTTNFVGTVAPVTATPHQYTSGGYLTTIEYQSGNMMDQWASIKANEIATKMVAVVNALIVTGTFTTDVQTIAASAFGFSDLNTIWGSLAKASEKYAVLASAYIAKLLPTTREGFNPLSDGIIGWNGLIPNDHWTGATANTQGFFCHPQAITFKAGVPLTSPSAAGAGLTQTVIATPNGVSVQRNSWYNTATRSDWFTLDVVMAAAVTDATAGRMLKSA
jgi:ATP-dependent Clp protease protease subunit